MVPLEALLIPAVLQRCKVFGMLSEHPGESVYDYARESISSVLVAPKPLFGNLM